VTGRRDYRTAARIAAVAFAVLAVATSAERQEGDAEGSYGLDLYRVR
jgi:hypothetical protein